LEKPFFAYRCQLIRHVFAFSSFKYDCRFTGVEAVYIAREGNDLNVIEKAV
jgi:hypothetical protein